MLQSFNHAELATAVCVLTLALGVSIGIILARINNVADTLRNDFIEEDQALYREMDALREYTINVLESHSNGLNSIKDQLNQPLYEVGNTIWYNKGKDGTPGVHQDVQGVIVSIEPSDAEPHYKVLGQGGIEEVVKQSLIIAWTN